jgi:transcriptional regulator with XRE-family HTH domain
MYIDAMEKQIDIRKFRKSKGWNQAELAKRLGTNIMTISRWESGKTPSTKSAAWFSLENLIDSEPAE